MSWSVPLRWQHLEKAGSGGAGRIRIPSSRLLAARRLFAAADLQASCLGILWYVKASAFGILFPLFIALLVPIRFALKRVISADHLDVLDAEEGPEEEAETWS